MGDLSPSRFESLRRRWSFGSCSFDEASWVLTVNGERVAIETKPLKILRELLNRPGDVVSKGELLDAIWPEVTVVEASLPTAIRKLRLAIGDNDQGRPIIETVAGIGYRIAIPVKLSSARETDQPVSVARPPEQTLSGARRSLVPITAAAVLLLLISISVWPGGAPAPATSADRTVVQRQQLYALRRLDMPAVERLIDSGWDLTATYDREGDTALGILMEVCEWDPGHDQRKLMHIARALIDAGARVDKRNVYGDTPYSIAKAKRFCGPSHPATKMMQAMCTNNARSVADRCLATYELKRKRA